MQNHSVKPVLMAEGLRHVYEVAQGELTALDRVDLAIDQGEFVAIVGPSGCGKSTLLRILGGLLTPSKGQVYLNGKLMTSRRGNTLRLRSGKVGFVFQDVNLMPWRTVLRNVTLPLEIAGVSRSDAGQRAQDLLELVGLQGFEGAYPRQLSGGMAKRVAIARALAGDPALLLLDEPFGSLDALSREQMNLELLRIWRVQKVTAVMVTHDLQEAVFLSDRVLAMTSRPGRVRAEIAVDLPRPRTLEVMYTEFFGVLARRVRESIVSN